jgi:hypothetical protein
VRRWLLAVVVVVACKGKHDEPAAEEDWTVRCEATLRALDERLDADGVAKLIDSCRPCGDWKPILEWSRPVQDGGPTREVITRAMDRCKAFCDSTAKTYFLGTLDDARGTKSAKPWVELGKQCKAAVSAVPDARFMSARFFALDRIARATAERGGELARLAGKLRVPLPAVSMSGVGPDLPIAPRACTRDAFRGAYTLLGDSVLEGEVPRARLGASGVAVDPSSNYPGARTDFKNVPVLPDRFLLFAPRQMRAMAAFDVLVTAERAELQIDLAFDCGGIPGTIAPHATTEGVPKETIVIDDTMTVQDLANEIGKRERASLVKLVKKP